MPLLMIEPENAPPPPETDCVVAGGGMQAVLVRRGQLLAIRDVEGGQPAGLFAASLDDPSAVLSPHHTRVFSNSFMLRLGMRLVTNKRRPAMVLGVSPPHLRHDLLLPLAVPAPGGTVSRAHALRDDLAASFSSVGLSPAKLADPVNLFLDVAVGVDGRLTPRGASSRAGDAVLFRVVMDLAVVVAAPSPDPLLWARSRPGQIAVRVRNEVADFTDWMQT